MRTIAHSALNFYYDRYTQNKLFWHHVSFHQLIQCVRGEMAATFAARCILLSMYVSNGSGVCVRVRVYVRANQRCLHFALDAYLLSTHATILFFDVNG